MDKKLSYSKHKNSWVTFDNSKPKIKLRKFIQDRAQLLTRINNFNFKENRDALIEEFENGGLSGLNKALSVELTQYKLKVDAERKKILKQIEDERIQEQD